jgi:DnaA family protein
MINEQLTIDFAVDSDLNLTNFYPKNNETLISALSEFVTNKAQLPANSIFYMHGLSGSGKSHVLQALCQLATENQLSSLYLPIDAFRLYQVEATLGMENLNLLCIDDVDLIKGDQIWQQAIFDLINRVLEQNNKIIFTSSLPPAECGFELADLVSRLQWGQTWCLKPLDDQQQIDMMIFRAKCKGIGLGEDVAQFIHHRLSRQPKVIMECLESLDKSSLEAKRKLTIPFVKDVMGW